MVYNTKDYIAIYTEAEEKWYTNKCMALLCCWTFGITYIMCLYSNSRLIGLYI